MQPHARSAGLATILATAHHAKFSEAIRRATGQDLARHPDVAPIGGLQDRRHVRIHPLDAANELAPRLGYRPKRGLLDSELFMRDYSEEEALLHELTEVLAPYTSLVTFNGKTFDDSKWLITRKNDFAQFAIDVTPTAGDEEDGRLRMHCGTIGTDDDIEHPVLLVYLSNSCAFEGSLDISIQVPHGERILGSLPREQQDFNLRDFHLLFRPQVGDSFNISYSFGDSCRL